MNRGVSIIGIIVIIAIGWYLVSPLFISTELQESIDDAFDTMSEEKRAEFDQAVKDAEKDSSEKNEEMTGTINILSEVDFKPRAHEVEGKALLIESGGKKILRFEDFETINGPNLHIYLSSDLGVSDSIDLGGLKATKGNFNYELDPSIDTDKYNKVLVWCVPFRVLFSYSELK